MAFNFNDFWSTRPDVVLQYDKARAYAGDAMPTQEAFAQNIYNLETGATPRAPAYNPSIRARDFTAPAGTPLQTGPVVTPMDAGSASRLPGYSGSGEYRPPVGPYPSSGLLTGFQQPSTGGAISQAMAPAVQPGGTQGPLDPRGNRNSFEPWQGGGDPRGNRNGFEPWQGGGGQNFMNTFLQRLQGMGAQPRYPQGLQGAVYSALQQMRRQPQRQSWRPTPNGSGQAPGGSPWGGTAV